MCFNKNIKKYKQFNSVAGILYLNDGIHQCVKQRDDAFARVPSLSLQEVHTDTHTHIHIHVRAPFN